MYRGLSSLISPFRIVLNFLLLRFFTSSLYLCERQNSRFEISAFNLVVEKMVTMHLKNLLKKRKTPARSLAMSKRSQVRRWMTRIWGLSSRWRPKNLYYSGKSVHDENSFYYNSGLINYDFFPENKFIILELSYTQSMFTNMVAKLGFCPVNCLRINIDSFLVEFSPQLIGSHTYLFMQILICASPIYYFA